MEVDAEEQERPEEDCEQRRKHALSGVQVLKVVLVRREEDADSNVDRTEEPGRKNHESRRSRCSKLQPRDCARPDLFVVPPREVQLSMSKGIAAQQNEGFER